MKRTTITTALAALLIATPAYAHNGPGGPQLHVNNRWKECSFQLDAALTQSAWRQFTGEAGVVVHFRPMVDAKPMGKGRFEFSILQWKTGISDEDAAWNDTFVHPDSTHWLFEGSGLQFPGLTVRAGITDRTDLGVYFTKNPNANYGFYGFQLQQSLFDNEQRNWSGAVRVNTMSLFGPDDVEFSAYTTELLASRRYSSRSGRMSLSPYAGVSGTLTHSHEKSAVVNLADATVFGAQAMVGAVAKVKGAQVAAEYAVSRVPSFSIKVGFGGGR